MNIFGTVNIPISDRSYEIIVGDHILEDVGSHLVNLLDRKRAFIITDKKISELHLPNFKDNLLSSGIDVTVIEIPEGEKSKSFECLESVHSQLLDNKIERTDTICAFGGGVVGDLAGFVASTILRGIKIIQIPTTLLAQVDAAIGGKNGINTKQGKNLIGTIYQPKKVISDISLLTTLPKRDFLAGYAEILKYGILGNSEFYNWLEYNGKKVISGDKNAIGHAVLNSVINKAKIISDDERELGRRAILNLGHTFAHALEAELGYDGRLLHGEAVSIGMVIAMDLSVKIGTCPKEDAVRVYDHLKSIGLPVTLPTGHDWNIQTLLNHMRQDKKVKNGEINFVISNGIGNSSLTNNINEKELIEVLEKHLVK